MVQASIAYAQDIGIESIKVHAHCYLDSCYERFGFEFIKKVEIVGEHQLIEMQRKMLRTYNFYTPICTGY